ncbi:MAG TPA: hypothetical protein VFG38_02690 [Pseudomonadales bacterium]|nr:hypothetical protein [Pseudomonadales bacterium]
MVGPLLFGVYVALFVAILYAAGHFVSTHWSMLRSQDPDAVARAATRDAIQRKRD